MCVITSFHPSTYKIVRFLLPFLIAFKYFLVQQNHNLWSINWVRHKDFNKDRLCAVCFASFFPLFLFLTLIFLFFKRSLFQSQVILPSPCLFVWTFWFNIPAPLSTTSLFELFGAIFRAAFSWCKFFPLFGFLVQYPYSFVLVQVHWHGLSQFGVGPHSSGSQPQLVHWHTSSSICSISSIFTCYNCLNGNKKQLLHWHTSSSICSILTSYNCPVVGHHFLHALATPCFIKIWAEIKKMVHWHTSSSISSISIHMLPMSKWPKHFNLSLPTFFFNSTWRLKYMGIFLQEICDIGIFWERDFCQFSYIDFAPTTWRVSGVKWSVLKRTLKGTLSLFLLHSHLFQICLFQFRTQFALFLPLYIFAC